MVSPLSLEHVDVFADLFANTPETKTYKRRYWILLLYCILSMLASMTFLMYVSMADKTGCYYGVSQNVVNWTAEIPMVMQIIFILPGCYLMDYLDIRQTLIVASFLQTSGSIIQFFALKPESFIFVMISNLLNALSSVFLYGLFPYIVSRWFPSSEVSRACVFGSFGIQLGVAVGVIFPPIFIPNDCYMRDKIEDGKRNIAYLFTIANTVIFILLLFTFQNKPPKPPTLAKVNGKEMSVKETSRTILNIVKNPNFILIFLMSGFLGGAGVAFSTVLNGLIILFFPGEEVKISEMNTVFLILRLVGCVCCGYILDYTHKFKGTTIGFCLMSLISFLVFSGILYLRKLWMLFISIGLFGIFHGALFPLSMEYGIEVIFPESELISSNLIMWSIHLFGIITLQIVSRLLDNFGAIYSNSALAFSLSISFLISIFLTTDYKRCKRMQED